MAGILANSVSKTMVSGDTSATDIESGYVTTERVTLSTSPTGSTYAWELSIPNGSAAARSALSSDDDDSPTFTPDVAGEYVVRCVVDGATTYVLRMTVVAQVVAGSTGGTRYLPTTDASITTPSTGTTVFHSSDLGTLAAKTPDGAVYPIGQGAIAHDRQRSETIDLVDCGSDIFLFPRTQDVDDTPVTVSLEVASGDIVYLSAGMAPKYNKQLLAAPSTATVIVYFAISTDEGATWAVIQEGSQTIELIEFDNVQGGGLPVSRKQRFTMNAAYTVTTTGTLDVAIAMNVDHPADASSPSVDFARGNGMAWLTAQRFSGPTSSAPDAILAPVTFTPIAPPFL